MDESEALLAKLNERYGSAYRPQGRLILNKERLFLYTGAQTKLKHIWMGLHIANTDLSLTIEGAQLFAATATKNIVTVTQEQAERYYRGEDLAGFGAEGPLILKGEDLIVGPGFGGGKAVKNILPLSRRTSRLKGGKEFD